MQKSVALPGCWVGFIFISDRNQVREDGLGMSHIRTNTLTKILNFILLKYW